MSQSSNPSSVMDSAMEGDDAVMMEGEEGMMEDDHEGAMEDEDSMMMEDEEDDDSMMEEDEFEFDVDASNFKYSVTEMRVKKGATVEINLNIVEGNHDWVIDEFDARTEVMSAGENETITFVADQVGTFEYYCSVGNHRQQGMVGTLIVE